ncbi:hypothetical protein GN244_ATG01178 [Phytophthora infestans]|uniref:Transmembrane protein n=1 Tax=Phytophthora infestans TaxID=4787 RepID=A0A833TAZ9_PHYIN|nr:hypothetical protein GN244_ATG01178 [Phytophthora infestans]KAF4145361.1 hypothetical protein GN958_ATG05391 [Phytophthora infestans]
MRLVVSTGEVILCVCALALALYLSPFFIDEVNANASNAWEFLLVWDDEENFLENKVIRSGLNVTNLYAMFTMTKINVYEPFGWILKAIQVQVVGLDSWWIRIVSTALHFVAAAVLARTSAQLLNIMALLLDIKAKISVDKVTGLRRERNRWYGCCISAMIFAIHPIHVEVIAWPSAQPYTLCALLSSLTLYVYVQALYRRLCKVHNGKVNAIAKLMKSVFVGGGQSDLLCCGLYLSALLSKSACILLPAGFFLVDILVFATLQPLLPRPTAREYWTYITRKLPVVAIQLSFIAVTLVSNYNGMHPDTDLFSLTLSERVLKATTMPAWVLRRILWPAKLRPHYQLRPGVLSLTNSDYLLSLSVSMALVLFTIWLFRHRQAPQHLLALAYFAIMVLPVSGLIQHGMVSAGCDRYAYFCSIVFVPYGGSLLAQLFGDQEENVKDQEPENSQTQRKHEHTTIGISAVFLLGGTLLLVSTSLMGNWRNQDALLEYSLRMDPTDWRILDQRATYFVTSERYLRSDEECRRLWELTYYYTPVGTLKSDLQRLKLLIWMDGINDVVCDGYTKLLEVRPDSCHVHNNVGVCLIHQEKYGEARHEFEQALLCPGYEDLYATPRHNLKRLDEWIALKEEILARGEEDSVPHVKSQIMF